MGDEGDDNRSTRVDVAWRGKGDKAWSATMPLLGL
jgi:hypothetical protein